MEEIKPANRQKQELENREFSIIMGKFWFFGLSSCWRKEKIEFFFHIKISSISEDLSFEPLIEEKKPCICGEMSVKTETNQK